jgi:phage-related minor tail protein
MFQFGNNLQANLFGEFTEKEQTELTAMLTRALQGKDLDPTKILSILNTLNDTSKKVASKGEGLYNVNEAAKEVKDTLATIGDGYKPTTFDTLNSQFEKLKINLDDAIKDKDVGYFAVVEKQLGMLEGALGDNDKALEFVEARALAISQIIENNAKILDRRSSIAVSTASLGGRKDAGAVLTKQKLKQAEYANSILEVTNNIRKEEEILLLRRAEGEEVDERKLRNLERQLEVLKAQDREYKRANTIAGQLQDTFRDGLDDMFLSIIDGTTKAKDAFKQLAVVVIQEMQRILAVRMASAIINMMSGMVTPGTGTSTEAPSFEGGQAGVGGIPLGLQSRYGGVFGKKGYAAGGIADGPDSGYNVLMHGREAIVPLPDGDKIPVELSGKGAGPVNSTINIVINNEGEAETSSEESSAFAEAIQVAVTREIAEQQRPGGLLSPI